MSTSVYSTFEDIYTAVIRDAKESTATTQVVDNVKRWINEGYEIVNFRKKRTYLNDRFVLSLQGKVDSDFSVTNASSIVTHTGTATLLSSSYNLGFKVDGFEENYEVESISGTIVVLTTTYKGDTDTAATGVLYQRSVVVDSSISEVYQLWHDYFEGPLSNYGPQQLRKLIAQSPANYDKASCFAVEGLTSTALTVQIWPYPDEDYTLYMDANIYPTPLDDATDEPLIPPQFRQILYFYALAKLFGTFHRNNDREARAMQDFGAWLARIDGLDEVSQDYPQMIVSYSRPRRLVRGRFFDPRRREDP